ncbi:MAG TPA: dienelactone hydrolase family protein [Acidimicrobiia bacterium]|nr:dienelactone hydrolase family protein [Acidimicrobiia bacterium]
MSTIALFHSVLGVRAGVVDTADLLREDGHRVVVVDQYGGRVFDDYEEAGAYAEGIGYPALMQSALDAVSDLDDGFFTVGYSNGGGMAQLVALNRSVAGVAMVSGALPLGMLGAEAWPSDVPAQIHYSGADPFRDDEWLDSAVTSIQGSGAPLETHLGYAGGHLFMDADLHDEFDRESAALLLERLRAFCASSRSR